MNSRMVVPCTVPCPCKDCTDRNAQCHSLCDKYKLYKTEVEAHKKKAVQLADQIGFDRDITRNMRRTKDKRRKWGSYI